MLVINGLEKIYDNGVKALNGVNLTVNKGMFGLLGPNGAGKSSLMRSIATLQDIDQGKITFEGIDVMNKPMEMRKKLGYLPQNFGVYKGVSAHRLLDHLAVLKGMFAKKERKELVNELLYQTNLFDFRDKAVSGFSGGMRQRFGIAQALLGNPDLLIVDEPTAGLDPEERNRFHNLLVRLGQDRVVILSTHIVEDVYELCPQMAILVAGKILLQGNPSSLLQQIEGKIWQKNVSLKDIDSIEKSYPVISKRLKAGQSNVHVYAEHAPEGFSALIPDLEDLYFTVLYLFRQNLHHELAELKSIDG